MHTSDVVALAVQTTSTHLSHQLQVLRESIDGVVADLRTVVSTMQTFDTAAEKIAQDDRLAPKGKFDEKEAAGRVAEAALDTFERRNVGGIDTRIAGVRAAVTKAVAPQLPTDPVERQARDAQKRQIWELVKTLDALEVVPLYVGGNPLEREVIEQAPRRIIQSPGDGLPHWAPFIDPELISRSVSAKAEQASPALAAEPRDLNIIRDAYAGVVATARRALREVVPSLRGIDRSRSEFRLGTVCHDPPHLKPGRDSARRVD